ncbi:hypothetical protein [Providencia manganoxydans]|uniref:hypothetical protein n=1 Tax=Providencia manganoxydans TaxID=2923283 RepID=UPI0034E46F93
MFITIEKDGSIHIQSHIFTAHYDVQGKLKWACGDMKAPEFIKIKDEREKKSVGFGAESFGVFGGRVFIDEALISKAAPMPTIKYTVSGLHSDEYKEGLKQAVKRAIRSVIRQHIKVVRDESTLKSPDTVAQLDEAISNEELEFDKFKQQVIVNFDQLQASITAMQCTQAASEQSTAQHLSGLQRQITQLNKQLEDARCKESINNMSIISLKQTMEQQEKSLAETIKRTIAEDLCRGGTLSRML